MARPKSEDKRNAILAAAIRVIVTQGLSAPTATIAHEAGVANGSLFTYFKTKADLLNQLYLELKTEMGTAALAGLPPDAAIRDQMFHFWSNWMRWATSNPEKRRVMAQLTVSEEITPETRIAAGKSMARIGELLEQVRAYGPMSEAPMGLVAQMMDALVTATENYILGDPDNAEAHSRTGFEALWRIMGSA
ncbi:MAG: TetR/AcrR family transcriptional regulator [Armatimonadota bacterium]